MNVNVYVDGFNLYYGCIRRTPYKWLDLGQFCRLMFPKHVINRIRYFTTLVTSRPDDPDKRQRQQTYIRALETIPNLTVHRGIFLSNVRRMPLVNPLEDGTKTIEVVYTEEKGSDVNLATHLLFDGFRGEYEMAIIISNDSDLKDAIGIVRNEFGLQVGIVSPHSKMSWALHSVATSYRRIRKGVLRASQFPDVLTDARGTITKPIGW